jgi:probable rRNA maturation factor
MPTKKPEITLPELSLSVQYAAAAPELPRWRIRRWVQAALRGLATDLPTCPARVALTVRVVDTQEGLALNREFRERDYATNVLTFEYGTDPEGTAHGDVVLCLPVLQREAAEQGKPLLHHAAHLVVHGTLHALGYDHLDDQQAEHMEALETTILGSLGISNPYSDT